MKSDSRSIKLNKNYSLGYSMIVMIALINSGDGGFMTIRIDNSLEQQKKFQYDYSLQYKEVDDY